MRRASGDDAVAEKLFLVEPERVGAVDDEAVELDERSFVDERIDALARGALPALVLLFDRLGAGGLADCSRFAPQLVVLFGACVFTSLAFARRGERALRPAPPVAEADSRAGVEGFVHHAYD